MKLDLPIFNQHAKYHDALK